MNRNGERAVNQKASWDYGINEKNAREVVDVGHETGARPTTDYIN